MKMNMKTPTTTVATNAIPIMAPIERLLDGGFEVVNTAGEIVIVDTSNFKKKPIKI